MRFLLVGPNPNRPTDGIIIKGIKNILTYTYANALFDYLPLECVDGTDRTLDDLVYKTEVDAVIICGTPWLWDNFQNSKKYANLCFLIKKHPYCNKHIFMGIGSCLNLKDIDTDILKRKEEISAMQDLYKDSLVICRDHLASQLLNNAKIHNYFLPCPAYYCYLHIDNDLSSKRLHNILIWTDPSHTISSIDWDDRNRLDNYYAINKTYYQIFKPKVYCAFNSDLAKALEMGLNPEVLRDWDHTLEIMRDANYVLSSRVHCCVPAFTQKAKVGIIPLDTRHYVLSDFGCPVINKPDDLTKLQSCHIDYHNNLDKYKNIITNYLQGHHNEQS